MNKKITDIKNVKQKNVKVFFCKIKTIFNMNLH